VFCTAYWTERYPRSPGQAQWPCRHVKILIRNTNSHAAAVPFCNNDKQKQRLRRKVIFVLLVNRIVCKSKPEAQRQGKHKEKRSRTSSPSPGHAPCFPSTIIIIREVQGAGRSWLDGQTGRATLGRCADLSKLERTENQRTLLTRE
jgi:hypothetical protein